MATTPSIGAAIAGDKSRSLVAVLRLVALTVALPLLLFLVLSLTFGAVGGMLMPESVQPETAGSGSLGFAIVATYVICLPIFIAVLIRHFSDPS